LRRIRGRGEFERTIERERQDATIGQDGHVVDPDRSALAAHEHAELHARRRIRQPEQHGDAREVTRPARQFLVHHAACEEATRTVRACEELHVARPDVFGA
jgi:hypothetical protein